MPRQQSNSCSIGTKSSLFYPRASLANQTSLDYLKINQDGFSKIIQTSCCKQWIFCLFVCLFSNWRNIKDEMCFMVTHWCFNMFQSSEWHRPTCCCTAVQGWWQNKTQTVLVAWSTFLFHICFWSDIRVFFNWIWKHETRKMPLLLLLLLTTITQRDNNLCRTGKDSNMKSVLLTLKSPFFLIKFCLVDLGKKNAYKGTQPLKI